MVFFLSLMITAYQLVLVWGQLVMAKTPVVPKNEPQSSYPTVAG